MIAAPLLGLAIGIGGGLASSLLLHTLALATAWRAEQPALILLLPIVALLFALVPSPNTESLRRCLRDHWALPRWTLSLSFVGTTISHIVGASVGREATALTMTTALAGRLARAMGKETDREFWLRPALSAGFAGAVGAPWAAAVFGLEFEKPGGRPRTVVMCMISAWTAHATSWILRTPHLNLPRPSLLSEALWLDSLKLALVVGGLAFVYGQSMPLMRRIFSPFWGSIMLLALFTVDEFWSLQGLSLDGLSLAFSDQASLSLALSKLMLTALSLASGFRGGEFIPLVFVGSHLGGWLLPGGAALGFGALFGAVTRTPVACALLSAELFGWSHLPYAMAVGILSFAVFQGFRLAFAPRLGYR